MTGLGLLRKQGLALVVKSVALQLMPIALETLVKGVLGKRHGPFVILPTTGPHLAGGNSTISRPHNRRLAGNKLWSCSVFRLLRRGGHFLSHVCVRAKYHILDGEDCDRKHCVRSVKM